MPVGQVVTAASVADDNPQRQHKQTTLLVWLCSAVDREKYREQPGYRADAICAAV